MPVVRLTGALGLPGTEATVPCSASTRSVRPMVASVASRRRPRKSATRRFGGTAKARPLFQGVHVLDQIASRVTRGFVEFLVHGLRLRIEIGAGTLIEDTRLHARLAESFEYLALFLDHSVGRAGAYSLRSIVDDRLHIGRQAVPQVIVDDDDDRD